jgi:hypothetical protein
VNSSNGAGSFSITLPITHGRGVFNPELSLSYYSGPGNGTFSLGWSIGLPSILRKTEKEIPKYRNGKEVEVFTLPGLDYLVPVLNENLAGMWDMDAETVGTIRIRRDRPRIESEFSRIEKINHPEKGKYWKVMNRNNPVAFYGYTTEGTIANPGNPAQIFKWLPQVSYVDKGNLMRFSYKEENLENVPVTVFESNRLKGLASFANRN